MEIYSSHLLFVLGLRGLLAFFAFLLESHFPEKQGVRNLFHSDTHKMKKDLADAPDLSRTATN